MFNRRNQEVFDLDQNTQSAPQKEHSFTRCIWHGLCAAGGVITFIRNLVANLLFLTIALVLGLAWLLADTAEEKISSLAMGQDQDPAKIENAPVLWLNLDGMLDDMPMADDQISRLYSQLSGSLNSVKRISLQKLVRVLDQASEDPEIKTVVADLSNLQIQSMQAVYRLTKACDDFKAKSGGKKDLIFFSDYFSQAAYLAASHAGEIVLDPMGEVDLHGISMNSLYFGKALERFKLTPYVFRAGTHKSAVEPLLRNDMSPEVKEEYSHLADSLWDQAQNLVKTGRPMLKGDLLPNAEEYLKLLRQEHGDFAYTALSRGLCDTLMTSDDLVARFAAIYPDAEDPCVPKTIDLDAYSELQKRKKAVNQPKAQIAVIYGIGEISSFTENRRSFSPDNILALLDNITEDKHNKGVLFYLDSGGGEVIASEEIRRAFMKLKQKGLKTAVYMADMTASGAYWIATAADKIYASPSALTGSIGVFAATVGADRLLNEYGVTQDGVSTSPFAQSALAKPLPKETSELISLQISNTYDRFLSLVEKSRGLKASDKENFAEGRVFTAQDAKQIGLVDEIGSFQNALDGLEAQCGLKKDESVWKSYTVPVSSSLDWLPQFLLNNFQGYLPAALKTALFQSNKLSLSQRKSLIFATEPLKPELY